MDKTYTELPAFPTPLHPGQSWQRMAPCDGLSIRDYFAANALQGLLADSKVQGTHAEFAERSYAIADAMIQARGQA